MLMKFNVCVKLKSFEVKVSIIFSGTVGFSATNGGTLVGLPIRAMRNAKNISSLSFRYLLHHRNENRNSKGSGDAEIKYSNYD